MSNKAKILFVDDEENQRIALGGFLKKMGFNAKTCANGEDAIELIKTESWDLVLSDLRMPGITGIDLLKKAKNILPDIAFILLTAHGSVEGAVESMRLGAFNYLTKPVDLDELEIIINKALENRRLVTENRRLKNLVETSGNIDGIVSESEQMDDVLNLVARVAPATSSVLILGESGTGKERIAQALHYGSNRANMPLVTINCAAIPESLIEAELFGHEKGAFTGAHMTRKGKVELANGGTLFIDEIGDLPLSLQPKILRFLQEGTIERLGSSKTNKFDIRVIAATHRNLNRLVEENRFREDLFFRLSVINITLPPLKDRKADIIPLAEHFVKIYSEKNSKKVTGFSRDAKDVLLKYHYPGNVRELENAIEAAVVLTRDEAIELNDLPITFREMDKTIKTSDDESLHSKIESYEKSIVLESLKKSGGNKSKAARQLGISEKNIRDRLKKWGYRP